MKIWLIDIERLWIANFTQDRVKLSEQKYKINEKDNALTELHTSANLHFLPVLLLSIGKDTEWKGLSGSIAACPHSSPCITFHGYLGQLSHWWCLFYHVFGEKKIYYCRDKILGRSSLFLALQKNLNYVIVFFSKIDFQKANFYIQRHTCFPIKASLGRHKHQRFKKKKRCDADKSLCILKVSSEVANKRLHP